MSQKIKLPKIGAEDDLKPVPWSDDKPEGLDLEIGGSVTGTLGQIHKGRNERRYRLLRAEDGNFYVNENADTERKHLFQFPEGTKVCLTRTEDVPTSLGNPMKTYDVRAPQAAIEALGVESKLPF